MLDLTSGIVVYVGESKGAEALEPFFKRLKQAHAKIEAVAMDMSKAYIFAVSSNLPKALIVFDHFHIIKLANQALTTLRRDLQREAEGPLQKKVLKGIRWILLKRPENLKAERNEEQRLKAALELNAPLTLGYYMVEDLRQIWSQPNKQTARSILKDWIGMAHASGIRVLQKLSNTLAAYQNGILNWYDTPITSAKIEGTNNKIRAMQRQSYGFRDKEFFKLKIYSLHETKQSFTG